MGDKWKFWFPQTRRLNHNPGCGYLYSPNSLVYTTCLDANQRMEAVEAVRCAAGRDWGIGFPRVVLTQLHMTACTSVAEGENENTQSPGHLPSPSAWARDNKRSGVDCDYSNLFLRNLPLTFLCQLRHQAHLLPFPPTSVLCSCHSWLWRHPVPSCFCAPAQGHFAQNTLCPLSFSLSFLQTMLCVWLMGHQMALGSTQAEFLFYANIYHLRPESIWTETENIIIEVGYR